MDTQQALLAADDEMFQSIDKLSLPTLLKKYGGVRPITLVKKGTDENMPTENELLDVDEMNPYPEGTPEHEGLETPEEEAAEEEANPEAEEEEGENPEEEAAESPEEEAAEEGEEEGFTIDDMYDLAEALVSGQFMGQVDKVRTFDQFGLSFLGAGVVAHINGNCYQLAIRMAQSGTLVDQAIQDQQGALDPEDAFEGDVTSYLEEQPLPGLIEVRDLADAGDPAGTTGASFLFDDGSDFRVYVLGSSSEQYDVGSMIDDVSGTAFDEGEMKADQACMRKIWAQYYKYYSGKYISAAMQAWSAGNYPMAAAAFEKARDGFQQDKNPKEYNCLDAWRQEADDKGAR